MSSARRSRASVAPAALSAALLIRYPYCRVTTPVKFDHFTGVPGDDRTTKCLYSKAHKTNLQPDMPCGGIALVSAKLLHLHCSLARGPAEKASQAGLSIKDYAPQSQSACKCTQILLKGSAYNETGAHQPAARAPIAARPHLAAQQRNLHAPKHTGLSASAQKQSVNSLRRIRSLTEWHEVSTTAWRRGRVIYQIKFLQPL